MCEAMHFSFYLDGNLDPEVSEFTGCCFEGKDTDSTGRAWVGAKLFFPHVLPGHPSRSKVRGTPLTLTV